MGKTIEKIIIVLLIISIIPLTVGFTNKTDNPRTLYHVYLKGKSLGLIKSKKELEDYIDQKQQKIKEKYHVDKVYLPDDIDIVKENTYETKVMSVDKIYKKIKDRSPFTIDGYIINIKGLDTKNAKGKKIKGKKQTIYVLDRKVFEDSVDNTVRSFVSKEDYAAYKKGKQKEIKDTGKKIEKIYIKNKITIRKGNIPVNKTIYQNKENLSKYLLFGTTKEQKKYKVKAGDTISDIAFNNKISTEEFLIANPTFTDEDNLLYDGQEVTLGVLKPQFSVVEEDHAVFREEKNYTTETKYDNSKDVGYTKITQKGVKGENKVTQKIQKVNGETVNVVPVNTEVIKEPVKEVIVRGGKKSNYSGGDAPYTGGGYGDVIATKGQFGWPASCSTVSSGFGYRWGVLHDGTDIAGCGYGSNIFAAQSGTVVQSGSKFDNGQYVTIDHHNGYFTMYAHLCVGCRYVSVGQHVEKGQVIGGMGQTGAATGVHLHFAIWKGYPYRGGHALNAMSFY
ncbi:MAG: peptidoglycan DD-metalloendopeptidase family protein [Bacilli bacterium]|nr:peptidoglycan DD-metalloendopeptidase family protein [Bacilli bacterium]MBR3049270.1 peptidoglycan DD-metalloendopeptidase family protein [Bacilli bacterium]